MAKKNYEDIIKPHKPNLAADPSVAYLPAQMIDYLAFLADKWAISRMIRNGLSYDFFQFIVDRSPFSSTDWSKLLNISSKSLQRYKQDQTRFKPLYAEKIIEISEVVERGLEVFDDKISFKRWLYAPSHALGGEQPAVLMEDSYGKQLVLDTLDRIDHGIFI